MRFPQYYIEDAGVYYVIYQHEDGHYSQVTVAGLFDEYEYMIVLE